MSACPLPPGNRVLEQGWPSANNVRLFGGDTATLVDRGYVPHAGQTVALLREALDGRHLGRLISTHSHSEHIGDNAAVQLAFGVPVAGWRARDPRWSPRSPACVPSQTMACGWPAMRSACASPSRCWSDGAWISIACRGYLASVPLYQEANERFLGLSFGELVEWLLRELLGAGVATLEGPLLYVR